MRIRSDFGPGESFGVGVRVRPLLIVSVVCALLLMGASTAQTVPQGFAVVDVNTSLDSDTVSFAFLPDNRILVTRKSAAEIKLIVNGTLKTQALVTVPDIVGQGEKGLLGIAVDPDFPNSPYIYVFHSHTSLTNRVSRYTVGGDLTDPNSDNLTISSQLTLIDDMPASASNHNGGTLRFGADKTLYISHGDDAAKPLVQDLTTLNGKILRINRDGSIPGDNPVFPSPPAGARGEIFAFGLRNPFRFQIDSKTDQLFIGDVGAATREELDLSSGGENFGWPHWEGTLLYDASAPLIAPDPTFPIGEYLNPPAEPASVIAVAAYRQNNYPWDSSFPDKYEGSYFYADYIAGWIRNLRPDGTGGWIDSEFSTGWTQPVDGTVGPDGAVYVLERGLALKRIVYLAEPASQPAFVPIVHTDVAAAGPQPEVAAASSNIAALFGVEAGTPAVYVKHVQTGTLLREITLSNQYHQIGVISLSDVNGNGADEIAVLEVHKTQEKNRVQVLDTSTGQLLNSIPFSPNHLPAAFLVVPDLNGSSIPEIAVLGHAKTSSNRLVQIKDALTDVLVSSIPFSPYYSAVALALVPSFGGTSQPEIAVLGEHLSGDGRRLVQLKDAGSGALLTNVPFSPYHWPRSLTWVEDVSGNGQPELAVLGNHRSGDNRRLVQLKDASTGAFVQNIPYSSSYGPFSIAAVPDISGNGKQEIAVFGDHLTLPNRLVQLKDVSTKALSGSVPFSPSYTLEGMGVATDLDGDGVVDVAVFGNHLSHANVGLVQIKKASDASLVQNVRLP